MNLLTKQYRIYRVQKRIQSILFSFVIVSVLFIGLLYFKYIHNSKSVKNYGNINNEIELVKQELNRVQENISILEKEITQLDTKIIYDLGTSESQGAFHANNIMLNVLRSTNDGVKVHSILLASTQMEITGVATEIYEISSLVSKLSSNYNVDITKTQQINHTDMGKFYAFKLQIRELGGQ